MHGAVEQVLIRVFLCGNAPSELTYTSFSAPHASSDCSGSALSFWKNLAPLNNKTHEQLSPESVREFSGDLPYASYLPKRNDPPRTHKQLLDIRPVPRPYF